jgi:REP element-mobilizing transposase RayT
MADDSIMTLKSASGGVPAEFSYRGQKSYHVTLPTFQTQPLFSDRGLVPPVLNALRDAALAAHFDVLLYTFLPDRVVLLIHGRTDESDMKAFLAAFRASSTAAVEGGLGHRLWKRTYLERMLRRGERPEHSVREIARLPVSAGLATSPGGYEFTGSFVTDVAKLIEPRRPAAQDRQDGRGFARGRRPFEPQRRPDARRGTGQGRAPEARRRPEGRPASEGKRRFEGGRKPDRSGPPEAHRGPEGRRPPQGHRGPGGGRSFEPRRKPEGRRLGFKSGPRRSGGKPPTSPRGKPRR